MHKISKIDNEKVIKYTHEVLNYCKNQAELTPFELIAVFKIILSTVENELEMEIRRIAFDNTLNQYLTKNENTKH